jgi:hypothetical protein
MLRRDPFAYLPAVLALTLAGFNLPARAESRLISLCSGESWPAQPDRDCDQACHIGCSREKRGSGRL